MTAPEYMTGRDAFEYVVRQLESATRMLGEKDRELDTLRDRAACLDSECDRLHKRRADEIEEVENLKRQVLHFRAGEPKLRRLFEEASSACRTLSDRSQKSLKERRIAREVAFATAQMLRAALKDAEPWCDPIPF